MNDNEPLQVHAIMRTEVFRVGMDATLGQAMAVCLQHRIRHLPVVDSGERLVGLVTDRDMRVFISHRLGTIMENGSDRESLHRHVHVMMVRRLVTVTPETTVGEAAYLMLQRNVGCLPVVDQEYRLIGIITTSDLLNLLAEDPAPAEPAPRESEQAAAVPQ
ncbi:MAG: CBS domain-containing protein [Acidobacteria bacterium]|nr:CBS domain-containing protein [Acidobacteriota bacterium]